MSIGYPIGVSSVSLWAIGSCGGVAGPPDLLSDAVIQIQTPVSPYRLQRSLPLSLPVHQAPPKSMPFEVPSILAGRLSGCDALTFQPWTSMEGRAEDRLPRRLVTRS